MGTCAFSLHENHKSVSLTACANNDIVRLACTGARQIQLHCCRVLCTGLLCNSARDFCSSALTMQAFSDALGQEL